MNAHFASLVLGLAQQANAALDGSLPPGAEGLGDPRQLAGSLIDSLGMLEEKTAGNLDEDEGMLLSQTLTALRFRFVQSGSSQSEGAGEG
jgi:hypothetical protein